jgi:pyruvate dehydrogenase E2 component (dihydrolipoamide acetyltransferase)
MATEVVLPALGLTVEKGKILEWYKKEGDPVQKGEPIFLVEADKVTTDVESPSSGVLAKILIPVGVEVPILTVVAIITEPGEKLAAKWMTEGPAFPVGERRAEPPSPVSPSKVAEAKEGIPGDRGIVPAARKKAKEYGLDLSQISGTGPDGVILLKDVEGAFAAKSKVSAVKASTLARKLGEKEGVPLKEVRGTGVRGRIMQSDVKAYLERPTSTAAGRPLGSTIPMSTIRRVISRRMSESASSAPHIYFFSEVWLDPLLQFREEVLLVFEKHFNLRPSINDFLIKAVALNIADFPMLNAQVKGEEIHIMPEINIGLAVAMPEGLIVPAIPRADRVGLVEIVRQRSDLVARTREGKLTLQEMERGTFTISSLAQYDITHFTAILNPPQSGILSVGKTDEKLVMVNGQVQTERITRLGLSVDHRIIDGTTAADFLQHLKWKLEHPAFTFMSL